MMSCGWLSGVDSRCRPGRGGEVWRPHLYVLSEDSLRIVAGDPPFCKGISAPGPSGGVAPRASSGRRPCVVRGSSVGRACVVREAFDPGPAPVLCSAGVERMFQSSLQVPSMMTGWGGGAGSAPVPYPPSFQGLGEERAGGLRVGPDPVRPLLPWSDTGRGANGRRQEEER